MRGRDALVSGSRPGAADGAGPYGAGPHGGGPDDPGSPGAAPTVVVVDPTSSGTSLTGHCEEYGARVLHLWQPGCAADHERDPHPYRLPADDLEVALKELEKLRPRAVWPGSEYGVSTANELSRRLGLPHNDPSVAAARRHKDEMMRVLAAANIPTPWSRSVGGPREAEETAAGISTYPVIVKPANSVGSDSCRICHSAEEVRSWCAYLADRENHMHESNSAVLVQEFLHGPQYIVNTVSVDGRHVLSDVWRYGIDEVAGKPMIRDSLLLTGLEPEEESAVSYVLACLDALGVRNGAAHSEVRLTARGPLLVEVNSRLMGPVQPADVYTGALGYSQAALLAASLFDPLAFRARQEAVYAPRRAVGKSLLLPFEEGRIRAMPGLQHIRRLPGFHSFAKLPPLGAAVSPVNPLALGVTGLAYFVHEDPGVLRTSLDALHELEESNQIFTVE